MGTSVSACLRTLIYGILWAEVHVTCAYVPKIQFTLKSVIIRKLRECGSISLTILYECL